MKDVYKDGHEREDVVAYRIEWAKRMMEHKTRMAEFVGGEDGVEEVWTYNPGATEEPRLVMVTHDESTFYANDYKQVMWLEGDESVLRKKGLGGSLMVSEFQCACHGTMRSKVNPGKSSRIITPRK